jgi:hypothetical protein
VIALVACGAQTRVLDPAKVLKPKVDCQTLLWEIYTDNLLQVRIRVEVRMRFRVRVRIMVRIIVKIRVRVRVWINSCSSSNYNNKF